jgi:hypothetical protein
MRKLILISFITVFITSCVQENVVEDHHTVIEDYIQLTGNQVLDETNNLTIPFSKQGYTLHLPKSNPIATIIMLSGSALDTTRNIDEFAIIKPALEKNIAVLFVSTGKVIEFLFTDKEIKSSEMPWKNMSFLTNPNF